MRIKIGVHAKKKRRKVLKLTKGYRGALSKNYRVAKGAVMHAQAYAFRDRHQRKREMRSLWIARLNAAARAQGLTYSAFMSGLKRAGVALNRKVMADLAVRDGPGFQKLVEMAKGTN